MTDDLLPIIEHSFSEVVFSDFFERSPHSIRKRGMMYAPFENDVISPYILRSIELPTKATLCF